MSGLNAVALRVAQTVVRTSQPWNQLPLIVFNSAQFSCFQDTSERATERAEIWIT